MSLVSLTEECAFLAFTSYVSTKAEEEGRKEMVELKMILNILNLFQCPHDFMTMTDCCIKS